MSYRIFGGVHDILSNVNELKALGPNQREKGQIIAVKDGDYRVYIWDPTATAKGLLCALAGEDPAQTYWPSKANTWYPQSGGSMFEERIHMIEEDGVRTDYMGNSLREDFGYLFVVPDDISNAAGGTVNYTDIPGRWVVMNYATLIDNIPWDLKSGNIIPRYNDRFDIGNAEQKVRDFYLSDSTMWMGEDHKITIDQTGQLKFLKRKQGKLPEHLSTHTTSQHGGNPAEAKRAILQAIKDDTEINAPEVDSLSSITEATDIPTNLNLTLKDWIRVAIASGFSNPSPSSMFGDSDFDDAITFSSSGSGSSSGGTIDPSDVGGYNLGTLDSRLGVLEGKFSGPGGVLPETLVDSSIFRESDFAAKFAEHINGETDIVRDARFPDLWEGRWVIKEPNVLNPGDFGTAFDTNWDNKFNTEFDTRWGTKFDGSFDTRFGTKGPGDILGMNDYISANTDVMQGVAARGYFDGGGNLSQSHGGTWSAAKTYVDSAVSALSATDLGINIGDYATITDLNNGLGAKLNTADLPDTSDFVTNAGMNTFVAAQMAGLATKAELGALDLEDIGGLTAALATKQPTGSYLTEVGTLNIGDITGLQNALNDKQPTGTYLSPGDSIDAGDITGTLATGNIPQLAQSKITNLTSALNGKASTTFVNNMNSTLSTLSSNVSTNAANIGTNTSDIASNTGDIASNTSDIASADSRQLTMDDALYELYKIAVTSEPSGIQYRGRNNNKQIYQTDPLASESIAATKLTGTISSARIPNLSASKITSGTFNTNRIPTLSQSKITGLGDALSALNTSGIGTGVLQQSGNDWVYVTSDKDLKNIIRVVPQDEVTTDYHLIGLMTIEYEWNQTADDLFELSGHVAEGFIAEQLEQLYPAPDPQNPPTSKEDGHIWWHEYMSDEQKALSNDVHNYYTFFNSEMLQAEIDAAKASL